MTPQQTQKAPSFGRALVEMIKAQPGRYVAALFLWSAIWTMPVLIGLVIAYFFDELAAGIDNETIRLVVVMTFAYAAGRSVVIFLGMRNHARLIYRMMATARRTLLARIFEMPGAASVDESPGEIVSRFRDDVEHVMEPFDISVDLVGALVGGAISLTLLWAIDPVITLVILVPVLVVAVVANRTGGVVRRYRREARDATEAITGFLGETFNATQAVKVAGTEESMVGRFVELNAVRKEKMVRDRTLTSVLQAVFRNTVNVGTGLVLLLAAGRLSITGETGISYGDFALFVFLLPHLADVAFFIGIFVQRSKQGIVSLGRLAKTMRSDDWQRLFRRAPIGIDGDMPDPLKPAPERGHFDSLAVSGLSYTHPGSSNGVTDVDLSIERGEFVVITGRVGSGKTTLLRAMLGLLPADEGEILWNGEAIDDPGRVMVPPHLAYTPQVPQLFSMTLEDNLVLGDDVDEYGLNESIYIATMRHDIDQMPEGLETLVGPRGVRLSGGQIQRSATARMLTRDSQLLVLDDVSSALDVETEQLLWTRLFNARKEVAALVVSHRHAALAQADRVIVMEDGRVVAVGTAAELQETSDTFRAIWEGALSAAS